MNRLFMRYKTNLICIVMVILSYVHGTIANGAGACSVKQEVQSASGETDWKTYEHWTGTDLKQCVDQLDSGHAATTPSTCEITLYDGSTVTSTAGLCFKHVYPYENYIHDPNSNSKSEESCYHDYVWEPEINDQDTCEKFRQNTGGGTQGVYTAAVEVTNAFDYFGLAAMYDSCEECDSLDSFQVQRDSDNTCKIKFFKEGTLVSVDPAYEVFSGSTEFWGSNYEGSAVCAWNGVYGCTAQTTDGEHSCNYRSEGDNGQGDVHPLAFQRPSDTCKTQTGCKTCDDEEQCSVTENGYILDGTTASICPAGTYDNGNDAQCASCEDGSVQTLAGQISCNICPTGQYEDGKDSSCKICTAGTYNDVPKQKGITACKNLDDGYIGFNSNGKDGYDGQDKCEAGTFQEVVSGDHVCSACDDGDVQTASGTTECNTCPAGTYEDGKDQACATCADVNQYQNQEGQTECKTVGDGYQAVNAGGDVAAGDNNVDRQLCPAGTAGTGGECNECTDINKYQDQEGQTECKTVPDGSEAVNANGQVADGDANVGYKQCSANQVGTGGSCATSCQDGKHPNAEHTECEVCDPGYAKSGTDECGVCLDGKTPNDAQSECDLCPADKRGTDGFCQYTCPKGQTSNADNTRCVSCAEGCAQCTKDVCEEAQPGYEIQQISHEGTTIPRATACKGAKAGKDCTLTCDIRNGQAPSADKSECETCANYPVFAGDSWSCGFCEIGTYKRDADAMCLVNDVCCEAMTATCLACKAGQTVTQYCTANPSTHGCEDAAGDITCVPCPIGCEACDSASQCTLFKSGFEEGDDGSPVCMAGLKYVAAMESCKPCGEGYFSAKGNNLECTEKCPSGTGSISGSNYYDKDERFGARISLAEGAKDAAEQGLGLAINAKTAADSALTNAQSNLDTKNFELNTKEIELINKQSDVEQKRMHLSSKEAELTARTNEKNEMVADNSKAEYVGLDPPHDLVSINNFIDQLNTDIAVLNQEILTLDGDIATTHVEVDEKRAEVATAQTLVDEAILNVAKSQELKEYATDVKNQAEDSLSAIQSEANLFDTNTATPFADAKLAAITALNTARDNLNGKIASSTDDTRNRLSVLAEGNVFSAYDETQNTWTISTDASIQVDFGSDVSVSILESLEEALFDYKNEVVYLRYIEQQKETPSNEVIAHFDEKINRVDTAYDRIDYIRRDLEPFEQAFADAQAAVDVLGNPKAPECVPCAANKYNFGDVSEECISCSGRDARVSAEGSGACSSVYTASKRDTGTTALGKCSKIKNGQELGLSISSVTGQASCATCPPATERRETDDDSDLLNTLSGGDFGSPSCNYTIHVKESKSFDGDQHADEKGQLFRLVESDGTWVKEDEQALNLGDAVEIQGGVWSLSDTNSALVIVICNKGEDVVRHFEDFEDEEWSGKYACVRPELDGGECADGRERVIRSCGKTVCACTDKTNMNMHRAGAEEVHSLFNHITNEFGLYLSYVDVQKFEIVDDEALAIAFVGELTNDVFRAIDGAAGRKIEEINTRLSTDASLTNDERERLNMLGSTLEDLQSDIRSMIDNGEAARINDKVNANDYKRWGDDKCLLDPIDKSECDQCKTHYRDRHDNAISDFELELLCPDECGEKSAACTTCVEQQSHYYTPDIAVAGPCFDICDENSIFEPTVDSCEANAAEVPCSQYSLSDWEIDNLPLDDINARAEACIDKFGCTWGDNECVAE